MIYAPCGQAHFARNAGTADFNPLKSSQFEPRRARDHRPWSAGAAQGSRRRRVRRRHKAADTAVGLSAGNFACIGPRSRRSVAGKLGRHNSRRKPPRSGCTRVDTAFEADPGPVRTEAPAAFEPQPDWHCSAARVPAQSVRKTPARQQSRRRQSANASISPTLATRGSKRSEGYARRRQPRNGPSASKAFRTARVDERHRGIATAKYPGFNRARSPRPWRHSAAA